MEGLGFQRGPTWILRGMGFALGPGECLAITGPSGAGKSTLLHLLLGLLEPQEGRILLEGGPWSPLPERARRSRRPRIQAVLQEAPASLPPHLTGWELLQEPLAVWGRGTAATRRETAARMAARIRFPEAALAQRPEAWSGGMAQRLALGRALIGEPAILVLDEPFTGLDPVLASGLLGLLAALKAEGLGLLVSGHDAARLQVLADRSLAVQGGDYSSTGTRTASVFT